MLQVGIYADDLTGALDAAAPFARVGMRAYVSLVGTAPAGLSDLYQVCSLNIDSRRAGQFAPFERASRAARELRAAGASILVDKLDSTARGHFGMEARGALSPEPSDPMEPRGSGEWHGPRVALLAPAYPAMRRSVSGGVLYVDGRQVTETDVGRDALTPVHSSDLREVVLQNVGVRPRLFTIEEVRDPGRMLEG
ncbi:MAG: four-carbon acid sugar kinase family protein, partial [Chloroflexota bacterium]